MQLLHKSINMKKTKDPQTILCEKLKLARENAGLTQAEAARLLRKPQWFISRSETGTRRVDLVELIQFGKVYGKPLIYFLAEFLD
jgi:transcriptional regulator with XRE-family HTH domain